MITNQARKLYQNDPRFHALVDNFFKMFEAGYKIVDVTLALELAWEMFWEFELEKRIQIQYPFGVEKE